MFPDEWEALVNASVLCPVSACDAQVATNLSSVIAHLNDGHGWTREAIAAWLEPTEEALALTSGKRIEEVYV